MADEIEFLAAEPTGGADEHLPEPFRHRVPGSPRTRGIAAIIAAVVLVGGGLVIRAATSGPPAAKPHATAQPTPQASSAAPSSRDDNTGRLTSPADIFCGGPVHSVPDDVPSVMPPGRSYAKLDPRVISGLVTCASRDVALCPQFGPAASGCTTTGEVPMAVVDAVRARFPGARYVASQSQVIRTSARLSYRYLELRAQDRTTIQVLIQQRSDYAGVSGNIDDGTKLIVRAVHSGPALTTSVQITRPSGARPDDAVAAVVAADPRLLAVG